MSREFGARFTLLDAQILDADDLPIGRVDDVELVVPESGGPPRVAALLTGMEALGPRLGGALGQVMAATAARLRAGRSHDGPTTIDPACVTDFEPMVKLSTRIDDLSDVAGLERWLSRNFVSRLPGAGDAPR
jgi:hypothetical protein